MNELWRKKLEFWDRWYWDETFAAWIEKLNAHRKKIRIMNAEVTENTDAVKGVIGDLIDLEKVFKWGYSNNWDLVISQWIVFPSNDWWNDVSRPFSNV